MYDIKLFFDSLRFVQRGHIVFPVGVDVEYTPSRLCTIQEAFIDPETNQGFCLVVPLVLLEESGELNAETIPLQLVESLMNPNLLYFGNGVRDDVFKIASCDWTYRIKNNLPMRGFSMPECQDLAKFFRYIGAPFASFKLYNLAREVLKIELSDTEKVSYQRMKWDDPHLSLGALLYSGMDAVLSIEIAEQGVRKLKLESAIVEKRETKKKTETKSEAKSQVASIVAFYKSKNSPSTPFPKGLKAKCNWIRNSYTTNEGVALRKNDPFLKSVAKEWGSSQ
jgi:hypothetical protein